MRMADLLPGRVDHIGGTARDNRHYEAPHQLKHRFCKMKQYRAFATRDDKTARDFLAAVYLAATFILLN